MVIPQNLTGQICDIMTDGNGGILNIEKEDELMALVTQFRARHPGKHPGYWITVSNNTGSSSINARLKQLKASKLVVVCHLCDHHIGAESYIIMFVATQWELCFILIA